MGATVEIVSFTFALFVLYLIEGIFIGLQLGRIYYFRHKLKSFQVGFLVQLFLWVCLRAAFFLFVDFLDNISSTLLYWIPVNIQFSTFSLLVVYYAHLYYARKAEWKDFKRKYLTVWVTVNVALALLAGVWIALGIHEETDPDWLVAAHAIFTGAIFFVLVCVLAWYGYKLVMQLKDKPHQAQTKLLARVSFRKILFITLSLFILFTSRCIYNFVSASGRVSFSITSGTTVKDFVMFLCFTGWEVIPTVLVLILFGAVSSTTLGAFSRRDYMPGRHRNVQVQRHVSEEPVLTTTNSGNLVKAELFNDPKRYDSDEDDLEYQYAYGKFSSESDKLLSPKHALNGGSGHQ